MNRDGAFSQTVAIVNRLGLHARAAGKLVKVTDQFDAVVAIGKDAQVACADSVMELIMLTAGPGDSIVVNASGPEAKAALEAVVSLVEDGFGEDV